MDEFTQSGPAIDAPNASASAGSCDPLQDYLDELLDCLAQRWLTGPVHSATAWLRLTALGAALGLSHLTPL